VLLLFCPNWRHCNQHAREAGCDDWWEGEREKKRQSAKAKWSKSAAWCFLEPLLSRRERIMISPSALCSHSQDKIRTTAVPFTRSHFSSGKLAFFFYETGKLASCLWSTVPCSTPEARNILEHWNFCKGSYSLQTSSGLCAKWVHFLFLGRSFKRDLDAKFKIPNNITSNVVSPAWKIKYR